MWKHFVCFMVLISLVAGCSIPHKQNKAEDKSNGDVNIKYQHLRAHSTKNNQNNVDLTGRTQTVGTEINTAKRIMKSYKEYQLVSVSINGNNMWITAHTRNRMSAHERMQREAEIHKKLKHALPQYNINVKLEEK